MGAEKDWIRDQKIEDKMVGKHKDYKMSADKNDKQDLKPDYSLIPKSFMDGVAYSMMAGELKYGRNNYTEGHKITQLTAAATRHLKQIEAGELVDEDTSDRLQREVTHMGCVAASMLMLIHQLELGTSVDDRFKPKKKD